MALHHPPAVFVADNPGLDFLNSIATPIDEVMDWLADGAGLLNWLSQAELVPSDVLARFGADTAALDQVAEQARALREWFRGFVQKHRGKPLSADALEELAPLNTLLAQDQGYKQLMRVGDRLQLQPLRRWHAPESLLIPIAQSLAQFVCDEDFTDVKACEGHSCTLLFADHTSRRARRWCSMAVCGNRAKQAAHRHRTKGQP